MPVLAVGGDKSFGKTMAEIMRFAGHQRAGRRGPGLRPLDHGGESDGDNLDGESIPTGRVRSKIKICGATLLVS